MIVHFPDHDFSDTLVEFDTDTYTAVYVTGATRAECCLSRWDWQERLRDWNIDLPALIAMDDYGMDEGL